MAKSNDGKAGKQSRGRRPAIITAAAIAFALLGALTWPKPGDAYAQLVQVRRTEARLSRWEKSAAFQFYRRITKSDPESYYRRRAEALEAALCKSRELVWVNFLTQSFPPQLESYLTNHPFVLNTYAPTTPGACENTLSLPVSQTGLPCVRYCYHYFGGKDCHLLCRPSDLAFWQSTLCTRTNRIRWKEMHSYAGDIDEPNFYLPDGSRVDLAHCQQWLSDSIAAGWKVGLMSTNSADGERWFVAFRQR